MKASRGSSWGSRSRPSTVIAHNVSNGFTELDGVRFLQGEENLKAYKVEGAKHFTQVFCRTCSSLMPSFNTELEIVTIPLGGLDLDPGIRPKAHIFVGNKASWHEVTGDISQFDTLPS